MANTDKDRILRRIKKCLALSKSDNEHEAAAALRQAKLMMDKYGIELEEATVVEYEVHDLSSGKFGKSALTQAEKALYGVVSRFFGCSLYSSRGWPVIIGLAPAPKIAEYAATVLLRQMRRGYADVLSEMENHIGEKLSVGDRRKAKHSYSVAWIISVESKVKEFAAVIMPEQKQAHADTVCKHWDVDPSKVKEGKIRGVNVDCPVSKYAARTGLTDGKEASINIGMQNEYSPPALLE